MRVTADELVVDPVGDVDDREPSLLLGDRGVELDVVEQVAELLDDVLVGRRVARVLVLKRVDELERLLHEVRDERLVGLLSIPRALLAQRAGQFVEPHVVVADRASETRHVDAREVVGLDRSVELAPRGLDDHARARSPTPAGS